MKKFTLLILIVAMVLMLGGCGKSEDISEISGEVSEMGDVFDTMKEEEAELPPLNLQKTKTYFLDILLDPSWKIVQETFMDGITYRALGGTLHIGSFVVVGTEAEFEESIMSRLDEHVTPAFFDYFDRPDGFYGMYSGVYEMDGEVKIICGAFLLDYEIKTMEVQGETIEYHSGKKCEFDIPKSTYDNYQDSVFEVLQSITETTMSVADKAEFVRNSL